MPRIVRGPQSWIRGPLRRGTEDSTNRVSRGNINMPVTPATGTFAGQVVQSIPYIVGVDPAEGIFTGQTINLVTYRMEVTPAAGVFTGQSITLLP